jgi:hypothetical protein
MNGAWRKYIMQPNLKALKKKKEQCCLIVNRIVLKTLRFSYTAFAVPLSFINKFELASPTIVVIIYVHVLLIIYKSFLSSAVCKSS